jgi:hypothetical protein
MAGGFALDRAIRRRIGVGRLLAWWLELVPAIALFLAMSTAGQHHVHYELPFLKVKLFNLVKSVTSGSITGDLAFVVGAAAFALLVLTGSRPRLGGAFVPGLLGLAVLYFALPFQLNSGSYVDGRLPIAIALLVLAGLDLRVARSPLSAGLIAVVVGALVVKQGALAVLWRSFDPLIDGVTAALDGLPAGSVIMQAECQPEATDVLAVYRERQPALTHLPAVASFDGSRFVADTWVIPGQQPVTVKPAYLPYYQLQETVAPSICTEAGYRAVLSGIEALARAEQAAGHAVPPIFLFLIRPGAPGTLLQDADLVARDRDYELYAVRRA